MQMGGKTNFKCNSRVHYHQKRGGDVLLLISQIFECRPPQPAFQLQLNGMKKTLKHKLASISHALPHDIVNK
jgi:hypothetical protein